ncbi:MAG: nicotinate-nucleotide adenylyltransferase [Bacteroidetes bacterium]|nr:nicotinate-nucleotide adenylyltransferase [Bacteroidota bacterium]
MKTGLFFGSFNPIHIGHLILASYMAEFADLKQVWFVVSPHNPLKQKKTLLNDYQRLDMVKLAIDDNPKFKAIDIEFKLPQPNYTIDTLTHLQEKFPKKKFVLIIGEDNLKNFHKWKNHEVLLEQYELYVYPRKDLLQKSILAEHPKVKMIDAPVVEISSSFIRNAIKNKKDVQYMLPYKVAQYLEEMNFYK